MIIPWLIRHKWLESRRSSIWQRNVALNILIGFFVILMMSYLLMLGLFLDEILEDTFPDDDPSVLVNSALIYVFLADLFMRYMMQPLPTLNIESYLHLPIKRGVLLHYIISRSALNILNFLPLLVIIPVTIQIFSLYQSPGIAINWLLVMVVMIFANNFLLTYLKRALISRPMLSFTGIAVILTVIIAGVFKVLGISSLSSAVFGWLMVHPAGILVVVTWLVVTYYLNFRFLKKKLYTEEIEKRKNVAADRLTRLKYFETMGFTGDIITLDVKLWWRHKRTKSTLALLPIFLLYGLFFYTDHEYKEAFGFSIFIGTFMIGGMMINYLSYAFAYESSYFDFLITRDFVMQKYLRAKLMTGMVMATICYILTIPYVFFGWKILLIHTVAYLFNLGIVAPSLLFIATYNKKKMDLSKGSSFNWQGIGANNWIASIGTFLVPVLIYLPFGSLGYEFTGLGVLAIIGIVGLMFQKTFIKLIFNNYHERKYIMSEGFRSY